MTKVLVVEDDPFNLELVSEILNDLGFDVVEAADGTEALEKTEAGTYDLILMDIELPAINGIRATQIIKNKSQHKYTPIIALTAYAMKGDKEKFLRSGFNDYISKPIDLTDFRKKMEKYRK